MNSSKKTTLIILVFSFFIILLRTAWICDDAYITMRSVDNFINGYGLTWNPGVRVQTYTHPLWMILLSMVYFISHHAYGSLMLLSVLFSIGTVIMVLLQKQDEFTMFIGWSALVLSNAFIDYSTSGLENPLSHFLLVVFAILYLKGKSQTDSRWLLGISFLMGLIVFNRMDMILIIFPALVEISIRKNLRDKLWIILIGFLPLII